MLNLNLNLINPVTEELITQIACDDERSVKEKFIQAELFQPQWQAQGLDHRLGIIDRFKTALSLRKEECAETLMHEVGKPYKHALNEINGTLTRIEFFQKNVATIMASEEVFASEKIRESISYEPLGVVGNISAWNYPYFVGSNVFIPALLTGNCVLYKPSELTSLSGLKIAEIFHEAGLPKEAFHVLVGAADVGRMLLSMPLQGFFFTGSYKTGKAIADAMAHRFIRTGYELGGKDPAYVCEDVDIKKACDMLVDGAFYNAGQSCCAVERIYVHERIYDDFLESFVAHTKSLVQTGDLKDEKTYLGPLARKEQLAILKEQVEDARAKGARVLYEAPKPTHNNAKGWYFGPVVLSYVDHTMKIMRDESFGPVIGIMKVRSDAEAVALMNETDYGLTASVHTRSEVRAKAILEKLHCGTVYWNTCDRVSPNLPWTGRKHSGMGSTLSHLGISAFLQPKAWHMAPA